MSSELGRIGHLSSFRTRHPAGVFIFATLTYILFTWYLFNPYFKYFNDVRYLSIVNLPLAAMGCFILSTRWLKSFAASFLAGALYGFGPFTLALTAYHPAAGFFAAAAVWLFLPAAFFNKRKWRWMRVPLSLLPVAMITAGFTIAARIRFYPLPIEKMGLEDIAAMFSIVMQKGGQISPGFYHGPLAALLTGVMLLVLMRRYKIMAIILAGFVLSICPPIFSVSPVMWLALPMICGAILAGLGVEAIVRVGRKDMKWLLAETLFCSAAFVIAITAAGFGRDEFFYTAAMYAMMAVAMALIVLLIKVGIKSAWPRWLLLGAAIGLDVFVSASCVVDKMF